MSTIRLSDAVDDGRPYGSTREEFLAACKGKMTDWLIEVERRYGLLERISCIRMKDGRHVMMGRFATTWYVNFYNPGNVPTEQELQCFLSFEAMNALWGLHEYLTTKRTNEEAWQAFIDACVVTAEETP